MKLDSTSSVILNRKESITHQENYESQAKTKWINEKSVLMLIFNENGSIHQNWKPLLFCSF